VSAFEPTPPTEPTVDMPDFMVVLRGYDRRQVEVWAKELASQIEQERLRADEAEKTLYRAQVEAKGTPTFTHLGSHVANIIEEAGRSAEAMQADAAERAQETIDSADAEASEIIKAAEHRAGGIEQDARHEADQLRAEGARVEEESREAAEAMRGQAEHDARTVLEEARDATDLIWQEAERERVAVEAETIRLETLRHRSLEQLGRVYGHLESVLDEVRAGIGRVEGDEDGDGGPPVQVPHVGELAAALPLASNRPAAPVGGEAPEAAGDQTLDRQGQPTLPEVAAQQAGAAKPSPDAAGGGGGQDATQQLEATEGMEPVDDEDRELKPANATGAKDAKQ
jgi:hypothetical protein